MTVPRNIAAGTRYVGLAVIPKRRRSIEHALGRIAELGGDALLITADGSSRARYPGVRHIDLLQDEMRHRANRLLAVSPKRAAGKLIGKRVPGRSLVWQVWSNSKVYKVFRFSLLWKVLQRHLEAVDPATVSHLLIAGVESWPIAWHISRSNPDVRIVWDVPDEWKRPPEEEILGLRRIATWGGHATWYIFSVGGVHRAEWVQTFAASSWIAQAGTGCDAVDLVPGWSDQDSSAPPAGETVTRGGQDTAAEGAVEPGETVDERLVRQDLTASLVSDIIGIQPEAVVLDALSEFTDVLKVGDWCTSSEFTESLGIDAELRRRASEVMAWDDPARAGLYATAVREVAARLLTGLPRARFILHRVWFTDREEERAAGRHAPAADRLEAARINQRLRECYEVLADAFGERLEVLELPAELRVMGKRHPRGLTHRGFALTYSEAALVSLDQMLRTPLARPVSRSGSDGGSHSTEG